jgi:hypothetical protein
LRRGTAAVTENFDVFELTLRRYLEQSNRLFPLEGDDRDRPDPPSSCIEDKKARQVWDRNIGADVYFTTFATFIKKASPPPPCSVCGVCVLCAVCAIGVCGWLTVRGE